MYRSLVHVVVSKVGVEQNARNTTWTSLVIREIPDHATFREKEHTLGWLDMLGGFPSLALCNLANFDQL